ncbi:MAG TPA: phosphoribosyltransferase [Planctomycetota bacterium]|nr:phosphoribosyltransferase [Planctomycetota bacterium]
MTDELSKSGLLSPEEAARFVRRGHFAYESGHHGDAWLALDLLVRDRKRLEAAAAKLAARLRPYPADLVVGIEAGGVLIAPRVAAEFKAALVTAQRKRDPGSAEVRYAIAPESRAAVAGKRALVIDDAINVGSAVLACMREIDALGGRVAAIAALVVRESADEEIAEANAVAVEGLVSVRWGTWPAADCPLCNSGVPLTRPEA